MPLQQVYVKNVCLLSHCIVASQQGHASTILRNDTYVEQHISVSSVITNPNITCQCNNAYQNCLQYIYYYP